MKRMKIYRPAVLVAALLIGLAACSDRDVPTAPPQNTLTAAPQTPTSDARKQQNVRIVFVQGGGNIAAGTQAVQRVQITDRKGAPLANRTVSWSSTNGGSFDQVSSTTDSSGYASTNFTAGTVATTQHIITATSTITASVTATVVAAAAYRVVTAGGDGGNAMVGSKRTIGALVRDIYGNAVAGYPVTFAAAPGAGSVSPASAVTNSQGIAWTDWTIGTTTGTQAASATAGQIVALDGSPVYYQVTATPGPLASITIDPSPTEVGGYAGESVWFHPYPYDAYHNAIDPNSLTYQWSSSNTAVVSVINGVAYVTDDVCPNDVQVTITATSGNVSGTALLTVLHANCLP